jgi:hypothetical protein
MTILLTLVLGLIAATHFAWGLNIWLPIRDEEQLARTVVGARGVTRMPGTIPCMLVVAGFCVIIAALWTSHLWFSRVILWGAVVVFVLRGALAYTKFWRRMTPEEPFNTYDQRYYAPLCLAISAGVLLVLMS